MTAGLNRSTSGSDTSCVAIFLMVFLRDIIDVDKGSFFDVGVHDSGNDAMPISLGSLMAV